MEGMKKSWTLDAAGIACLSIGMGLLQAGEHAWGAGITILGGGLLALKYRIRQ